MSESVQLILITGCSGSGKDYVSRRLIRRLQSRTKGVATLDIDDYHKSLGQDENHADRNWDHPNAIDFELYEHHLRLALEGKTFESPVYCFETSQRLDETDTFEPESTVVSWGNFALWSEGVRALSSCKVFIDTPINVCYKRRFQRDQRERRRSPDSIIQQWQDFVEPGFRNFIDPMRKHADVIVSGTDDAERNVDLIIRYLDDM